MIELLKLLSELLRDTPAVIGAPHKGAVAMPIYRVILLCTVGVLIWMQYESNHHCRQLVQMVINAQTQHAEQIGAHDDVWKDWTSPSGGGVSLQLVPKRESRR